MLRQPGGRCCCAREHLSGELKGKKLVLFLDVTNVTGTTVQELRRKVKARNDRHTGASKIRWGQGTPTRTGK